VSSSLLLLADVDLQCSFDHPHWDSNVDCHWSYNQRFMYDMGFVTGTKFERYVGKDEPTESITRKYLSKTGLKSIIQTHLDKI
jgi:hypothetical protein